MEGYVIVTGATGGMGSAAVEALAAAGRPVIMACRNVEKAYSVRADVLARHPGATIEVRQLDLCRMHSVRVFAADIITEGLPIAGLFNNAGMISREGYTESPDSLERTWSTNYFGPWLLTNELLPAYTPGANIVNMVSLSCRFVRKGWEKHGALAEGFTPLRAYARSKRALISFTCEFSRRHPELRVNMADPGIVGTDILNMGRWFDPIQRAIFKPLCKTPAKGVKPALAALNSSVTCRYFVGRQPSSGPANGRPLPSCYDDPALDATLWTAAERLLNLFQ